MKHLYIIILLLFTTVVNAQNYVQELYGFRLGQFREALSNELGKPLQTDTFADGFQYDTFLLKPDTSLYMICEYAAENTNLIWSIQLTGVDSLVDVGFSGIHLGISKESIVKKFGKPTEAVDIGEYGQRWEYGKSNFSFEINPRGKLSSIKIRDISSEVYPGVDVKKIPRFSDVVAILTSGDNRKIAGILAPDVELYRDSSVFSLKKALQTEILTDYSRVFSTIKDWASDLKTLDLKSPDAYEENGRLKEGEKPMHVIKIHQNHQIKEIVMKYFWGKYVIWEIQG